MKGVLFIALACFLWALDTLIRYPLIQKGLNPITLVFAEHAILVLVFIPVYIKNIKKYWNSSLSSLFSFFIVGALGSALATYWFSSAFYYLNPSIVILLQKLQVIFALILAKIILKEQLGYRFLFWAFLCLIGSFLVSYPDLQAVYQSSTTVLDTSHKNIIWGYIFTFLAALSWGATTIFGKKLSTSFSELEIMSGRYFFGLVTMTILLFQGPQFSLNLSSDTYSRIFIMVMIVGLASMFIYYKGLRLIPAKRAALTEMLFPFFAVFINWIVLDKQLLPVQIIGGLMVTLSASVIQIKRY